MSRRDEFVAAMKIRLDKWGAELNRLEAGLENAEAHVRDRYQHTVGSLREKHGEIENKLDEIRDSGEDAWEELKDEAERIWVAFKAGMDAIRDFSDHS